MNTPYSMTTDTLRLNVQDMEIWLNNVRKAFRIKADPKPSARRYVACLRIVSELQEKARSMGAVGPLVEDMAPIPLRTQLVGYTPEQRKAIEWKPY